MNAITNVSPGIAEAMSAAEVLAHCRDISAIIGPKAEARATVMTLYTGDKVMVSINPLGISQSNSETFRGNSWADAFEKARTWAANFKQVRRNGIIKRMALAIIEITDEHGSCAEARLKGAGFDRDEITEFHETACARAGEMAMGSPFSVLMEGAA